MKRDFYLFDVKEICRNDNTIKVFKFDNSSRIIPVEKIDSLYVFSEIKFNTKFLNFISQKNIILNIFNYFGYYSGSYYPRESNVSGELLISQVNAYQNKVRRMKIASSIIESATYNIYRNLRYYYERGKTKLEEDMKKIKGLRNRIKYAEEVQELMGIEGNIRKTYYNSWEEIIDHKYKFDKRVRRPPNNIINTLISFINNIVYTTVLSEIYKTQLNPTISYLHEPSTKRFSLSLDLSEIFKPLITDRIIFRMINRNQIKESDFKTLSDKLYIKDIHRKKILKEIDETLLTKINHKKLNRKVSYKYLIRLEAYKLIKYLLHNEKYSAFKIWW